MSIISEDAIYNLYGQILDIDKRGLDPTGKNLESVIFQSLRPFYKDVQLLGSPSTIVDIGLGSTALDVKSSKTINHLSRVGKSSTSRYIKEHNNRNGSTMVAIDTSIMTPVRRPNVNLQNYQGDPSVILKKQIEEYKDFAFNSLAKGNFKELYSLILQYGKSDSFFSVKAVVTPFSIPDVVSYHTGHNTDGTPNSYYGLDEKGIRVFEIRSFNRGSSNLIKRFDTSGGISFTWNIEHEQSKARTKDYLLEHGTLEYHSVDGNNLNTTSLFESLQG